MSLKERKLKIPKDGFMGTENNQGKSNDRYERKAVSQESKPYIKKASIFK